MKVIDPQEQIKKEKQKICMWLMNSKADIDDELLLNMSYAFFSEMKNAEEKKFKQFCEWRESDNFAAELEHCLSKKCHIFTIFGNPFIFSKAGLTSSPPVKTTKCA